MVGGFEIEVRGTATYQGEPPRPIIIEKPVEHEKEVVQKPVIREVPVITKVVEQRIPGWVWLLVGGSLVLLLASRKSKEGR